MNETSVVRPFLGAVVRVTAALGMLAGLVTVAPALIPTPAQAAEIPTPMSHTIDYIILSTSPNADFLSTADLQTRTDLVSHFWNRASRGVVTEIKMGRVFMVPNFSSRADLCNLSSDDRTGIIESTLGYSPSYYVDNNYGHYLAIVATRPDALCGWNGLTIAHGIGLSASGMILVESYPQLPESDAATIAHELGHVFGLDHAAAASLGCAGHFWDGPFSSSDEALQPHACPLGSMMTQYGDSASIMSNSTYLDKMTINGPQMHMLGLLQPGSGLMNVTAGSQEQLITVHDRRLADLSLLQTVRLTAVDPDGPGPCGAPLYHIDYDRQWGGVQIFRVPTRTDCGSRELTLGGSFGTVVWTVPTSYDASRSYFLPGESRLTESGKVQIRVVSVDTNSNTATIGIRRTDTPGFASLQLTARALPPDNTVQVESAGGQVSAVVTTNQPAWSATRDQSWAEVTRSGASGEEVAVRIAANPTAQQRTVVVTVQANNARSSFSVVQQAGPSQDDCATSTIWSCGWPDLKSPVRGSIETSGDRDRFQLSPQVTGTWSFLVSGSGSTPLSNLDARVVSAGPFGYEWPLTKETLGNGDLRVSAELEAAYPCVLEVSGTGGATGSYTVAASTPAPQITPSQEALVEPGDGGSVRLTVTANIAWAVGSLPDWLRTNYTTGYTWRDVKFFATPNTSGQTRTWPVTFSGQGQSVTVSISQPTGSASPLDCGVTPSTACTRADMSSQQYTRIDYAGDIDWFRFTPTVTGTWSISSTGSAYYGILYLADGITQVAWNQDSVVGGGFRITTELTADQTYYVEVQSTDLNRRDYTLTTTPPGGATITVSPGQWDAPDSGGTKVVQVTSNAAWKLSTPGWITTSAASGYGNDTVTLTATPNKTGQERNDTARFTVDGQQATITLRQAPQPPDHCGDTPDTACTWSNLDTPVNGVIETEGDIDWYKITPTISGKWTFAASVPASGGAVDTMGSIFDSNGVFLTYNSDAIPGVNPQFSVEAELVAGRTYYLEVKEASRWDTGAFTVTATGPETQVVPTISVSPTQWDAPSAEGTKVIQVTSNSDWQLALPNWITASADSGHGNATVTLTAKPNTTGGERNETVQFTVTGQPATKETVSVRQPAQPVLQTISLSLASWTAPDPGGFQPVQVTSNAAWQASVPDWITANPPYGNGNTMVTLVAKPNTTGAERNYTVRFAVTGQPAITATITVNQPAPVVRTISASPTQWDAPPAGGNKVIQITSNSDWQFSTSDWVDAEPRSGIGDTPVTLTVKPNTTGQQRTETLRFHVYGQDATVTVRQDPQPVQPTDDCGATTATACNWANLGTPARGVLETGGDRDWFKFTPTISGTWAFAAALGGSGSLYDTYGILYDANGTYITHNDDAAYPTNRQFLIKTTLVAGNTYYLEVRDWYGTNTGSYTVTATAPEPPVILVSPPSWTAPDAGGTKVVQVTSNSDWQVSVPDWITADRTSGNGNATVTLTAKPNTTGAERNYTVRFAVTGQPATNATITVNQPAQPVVRPGDDCGDTAATACNWANLGSPINGKIEIGGDKDWYKIVPTASGPWMFTASVPATGGAPDTVGTLYKADGTAIAQSDDSNNTRHFAVAAQLQAGATYYLQVRDYNVNNTGLYTVTATDPSRLVDDCGDTTTTACSWTNPGTPINGRIEIPGDKDWFKITPTISGTWVFRSSVPWTGGLGNPYGTLYTASGTEITHNDGLYDPSRNFNITAVLQAGTTYYLEVKVGNPINYGAYTLTAIPPADTQPITLGTTKWYAPGDESYLTTTVTTDQAWTISQPPSWLTISPGSGTGTTQITVHVTRNTTGYTHQWTIYFTNTSGQNTAIYVEQPPYRG